jgi:hypothetical protein
MAAVLIGPTTKTTTRPNTSAQFPVHYSLIILLFGANKLCYRQLRYINKKIKIKTLHGNRKQNAFNFNGSTVHFYLSIIMYQQMHLTAIRVHTEQAQQQHHNRCIYSHHGQSSCFYLAVLLVLLVLSILINFDSTVTF